MLEPCPSGLGLNTIAAQRPSDGGMTLLLASQASVSTGVHDRPPSRHLKLHPGIEEFARGKTNDRVGEQYWIRPYGGQTPPAGLDELSTGVSLSGCQMGSSGRGKHRQKASGVPARFGGWARRRTRRIDEGRSPHLGVRRFQRHLPARVVRAAAIRAGGPRRGLPKAAIIAVPTAA